MNNQLSIRLLFTCALIFAGSALQAADIRGKMVQLFLYDGQKLTGTPEWTDSTVVLTLEKVRVKKTVAYGEIRKIWFLKKHHDRAATGAAVGSVAGGVGAVVSINAVNGQSDGWDPTPMFGLMGGCCLGTIPGYFIGRSISIVNRFNIAGDLNRFRQASAVWADWVK